MEISEGIEIADLGLWIPKSRTLVFADFHMGFEEALNKTGVLIPRFHLKDVITRLEKIFAKVKPETIVINGDIKHEFGKISEQEWRETLKLIDFLAKHCKRLVLVKGNHDKTAGHIAGKRGMETAGFFESGKILIIHGDKIPKSIEKYSAIIIGHEHPAVSMRDSGRVERFKCFLCGKYLRKTLIVQPSFNLVTEGTDVLREKTLSPFLEQSLDRFKVYVAGDKTYDFGRIKDLRRRI